MKSLFCISLILIFFTGAPYSRAVIPDSSPAFRTAVWDTIPVGDINSDGSDDTAYVYTPAIIEDAMCVNDSCFNLIKFSCKLPDLLIPQSIYCNVRNAGYLSRGNISEIIVLPDWFQGCWGNVQVYSFKKGKWKRAAFAEIYKCLEDYNVNRIKKENGYYYLMGEKFNIKTGSIKKYKTKINLR